MTRFPAARSAALVGVCVLGSIKSLSPILLLNQQFCYTDPSLRPVTPETYPGHVAKEKAGTRGSTSRSRARYFAHRRTCVTHRVHATSCPLTTSGRLHPFGSRCCSDTAVAVAAVYAPVVGYPFVTLDDPQTVSANPQVQRGLTTDSIVWALTEIRTFYWQPLTWLSHMCDVQLFGQNAGGHHASTS